MNDQRLFRSLLTEITKLPVIDTHEHLCTSENVWAEDGSDVLREYLLHYLSSDLISAGLSRGDYQTAMDTKLDLARRWKLVEPYWEVCRFTGYARALDLSVRAIYGIDGIRADTVQELNRRFLASKTPGHYAHVLRELCGIETSLVDVWTFDLDEPNGLFRYIWQPMNFVLPSPPEGKDVFARMAKTHGIQVRTLDDWLTALETELDYLLAKYKVRVLKCAIAYRRSLRFEKTDYAAAEALFARALRSWELTPEKERAEPLFPIELQDFMMHRVLKLAGERKLTVQFHTGLLEGNGNTLSNSDPALLTNLFLEYPDVSFDLFHMGYPYQGTACALAKMFPNVTLDMCWAHIISPSACVAALQDFLDAVPYNKISAFGGDYLFPDGIYGHLTLSRENVARTLAGKIERGVFGEEKALDIARALYYDNPKRIFQL